MEKYADLEQALQDPSLAIVWTTIRIILYMLQVHAPFATLARATHDLYIVYEITLHS